MKGERTMRSGISAIMVVLMWLAAAEMETIPTAGFPAEETHVGKPRVLSVSVVPGLTVETYAPAAGPEKFSFDPSGVLYVRRGVGESLEGWIVVGSMNTARAQFSATLLGNGQVLIAGGRTAGDEYTSSCELFDPATNTIAPAASMNHVRNCHEAIELPNGKVLVVGGQGPGGVGVGPYLYSCELFDPLANSWTDTGSLGYATGNHRLILLDNGKVLKVCGASHGGFGTTVCEIYNPATGSWSNTGSTSTGHQFPACVKLANGKVLVAGGYMFNSVVELFNPAAGTWSGVGNISQSVSEPEGVQLDDGRVLIMGGTSHGVPAYKTVDVYDPVGGTVSPGPDMLNPRNAFCVVKLGDGDILAISGYSASGYATNACDRYDYASGSWVTGPPVNTSRIQFEAVYTNGVIYIFGGTNPDGSGRLSSIEALTSEARDKVKDHLWMEYR